MSEFMNKIKIKIFSIFTLLFFLSSNMGVLYGDSLFSGGSDAAALQVELFFRENNFEEGLLGYLSFMARAVPEIEKFKYPVSRKVNGNEIFLNFKDARHSGHFLFVNCSAADQKGPRFYDGVIDLNTKDVFIQDFAGKEETEIIQALEGFSKSFFHSDYENLIEDLGKKAVSRQAAVLLKNIYDKDISLSVKEKSVNSLLAIAGRTHSSVTKDMILDLIKKEEYPYVFKKLILFSVYYWQEEVLDDFKRFARQMEAGDKQRMIKKSLDVLAELKKDPIDLNDGFTIFWNKINKRKKGNRVRAIDIGCGAGDFLRGSKKYKWGRETDMIGIDESRDMVMFSVLYTIAEAYQKKWDKLDQEDGYFDLVTFNFPSPNAGWGSLRAAFMESYRVCSNGAGFAFCSTNEEENGFDKTRVLELLKEAGFRKFVVFDEGSIPESYPQSGTHAQLKEDG